MNGTFKIRKTVMNSTNSIKSREVDLIEIKLSHLYCYKKKCAKEIKSLNAIILQLVIHP